MTGGTEVRLSKAEEACADLVHCGGRRAQLHLDGTQQGRGKGGVSVEERRIPDTLSIVVAMVHSSIWMGHGRAVVGRRKGGVSVEDRQDRAGRGRDGQGEILDQCQ